MSSTINASTASGGGVITTADASGILQLQTAGVTGLTIDASQNVTFAKSILTSGTAVASTSGTSIDFTGIPSWVKRITVMFAGVGTSSTSIKQIQLGNTAVVTSGYTSASVNLPSSSTPTAVSTGLHLNSIVAADRLNGAMVITLQNSSTNTWEATHNFNNVTGGNAVMLGAGSLALSSVLDRVRITTVNGTDTFTAGSINIMYE